MLFTCFSFFVFHSLSFLNFRSKRGHITRKTGQLTNSTYEIDQPGLHEISSIKGGDTIKVKFNQRSLRLFIFFSSISKVYLKNLYIDGSDLLSNNYDEEHQVAFAVDADQEAIFNFDSHRYGHHHNFNKSFHEHFHDRIFNRKNKRSFKERALRMLTKFDIHHKSYENDFDYDYDSDFDIDFNHVNAVLWLLPRDVCGKSSIFEYGGGNANLSVKPTTSIITSKTDDEITYSNCIFSPLFDIFNTNGASDVSIGIRPTESDNYYPSSYKSSSISIYTDNINNPDFTLVSHQTISNISFSKPFFTHYEIKQTVQRGQPNSPLTVETFLMRKVPQSGNFDYRKFDLFCLSGSVKACDSKSCFHDDQIELNLNMECVDEAMWNQIFAILASVAVLITVIVIVIICLCCVGCCACCGLCFYCCKNSSNGSPILIDHQNRHSRHHVRNAEGDLEVPLVSLDNGTSQYHQPVPVVPVVPVYGGQPGAPNAVLVQQDGYQVPVQIQQVPV